jgi:hypothetical protein
MPRKVRREAGPFRPQAGRYRRVLFVCFCSKNRVPSRNSCKTSPKSSSLGKAAQTYASLRKHTPREGEGEMKNTRACEKVKIKKGEVEVGRPILPHPCPLPLVEGNHRQTVWNAGSQFAFVRTIRVKAPGKYRPKREVRAREDSRPTGGQGTDAPYLGSQTRRYRNGSRGLSPHHFRWRRSSTALPQIQFGQKNHVPTGATTL